MKANGSSASWIVTPVVLGLVVSWLAVIWVTVSATEEMDLNALHRETLMARSSTRLMGDPVVAQATDYAWWNDAIRNLVLTTDAEWADDNIGSYIHDAFGFTGAFVVSGGDHTLISYEDGEQTDTDAFAAFPKGLDILIERTRAASVDQPVAARGILIADGGYHVVAVSAFMQENPDDGLDLPRPLPVLIFSRRLDEDLVAEYADILQLPNLSIVHDKPSDASVPVKNPGAQVIGYLTWNFVPTGNQFFSQATIPLVGALVFTMVFVVLFVQRVIRLVKTEHKLRVANLAKSQFLANMSHELRTPLWAIIGFSGSMKRGLFGPIENDKYQDYLDDISLSAQHLLDLINDILDVSAIEAGSLKLRNERIDIGDVVESATRLIKPSADEKNIKVTATIAPGFPALRADKRRVKQALLNLCSNAVKFSSEGSEVTVSAQITAQGQPCITVSDTGMGMNDEEIQTALRPFGQVDSGLDRQYEGTGLGLPLTKGLVEHHGGTLTVVSEKGRGTQVSLTFPQSRIDVSAAE